SLTPSARVLRSLREDNLSFFAFAQRQSERHAAWFRGRPLDAESLAAFEQSARDSLQAQAELEANQQGSFEEFVAHYMAAIEPGA
ncbi:MAG TPA: glutamate--cysteine ligase, partial [Pseudomonas sp.]